MATFFREEHRGAKVALMGPMTKTFLHAIHDFVGQAGVDIAPFAKGKGKDGVTQERLARFTDSEGILYIGKAQEKFNIDPGHSFPWLMRSSVMCNHFYFYVVDKDFGPLFVKFASYFPYTARICINGHEYAKRKLAFEGIEFEALDNGILSCADPTRL
uniref:Uncharacterized protein n=1 Tax=Candidatus Kentrum sp. TC TaxID=2126339 RepID=A0A450Z9M0_9GAMM|nr:MAG: hypothetical protein BECKTC1821D_GA0114238_110511 [Candidatus Kentron sp. TC]VFK63453.1 MAG: hypothetical protein BECKTC1821F_GA0114240_109510 [Candidatus Kentron sp. TC]